MGGCCYSLSLLSLCANYRGAEWAVERAALAKLLNMSYANYPAYDVAPRYGAFNIANPFAIAPLYQY